MNGETQNVVVTVTEKTVERTIALKPKAGAIKRVEANEDNGALVEIERSGFLGEGLGSGFRVRVQGSNALNLEALTEGK